MNLTIIPIDGAVYIDGVSYSNLNLDVVPSNIHALQWKTDKGWIEFVDDENGVKPQNQQIIELPQWALDCVEIWQNYTPPVPELENPIPTTTIGE
jgi:hypothetical protein